jgi:hypothetical protein
MRKAKKIEGKDKSVMRTTKKVIVQTVMREDKERSL